MRRLYGAGGGFVKDDDYYGMIPNGDGITECRDGTCSECCKRKS